MGKNQVTEVYNFRNAVVKSAAYTAAASDDYLKVSGTTTITLPVISSTFDQSLTKDKVYKIENSGTAVVTVAAGSGNTIDGGSSYTLNLNGDYVIITIDATRTNWRLVYPDPLLTGSVSLKDDTITGVKLVTSSMYMVVAKATSGTTAQNVFGSGGAPHALTVTSVAAIAKDINAGNMILKIGANTVASFAKSTTAGVVTGEDGALVSNTAVAGDVVTVESSTTNGDGVVLITFTVA